MAIPNDSPPWSLERLTPPWGEGGSIYEYLREDPRRTSLPDESTDPGEIKWAPGAQDGVFGHHVASPEQTELQNRTRTLEAALEELLRHASDQNLANLYQAVAAEPILRIADLLQESVAGHLLENFQPRLAEIGRYLILHSPQREATKFGILLLGISGSGTDQHLLETLAVHDEFTLFAAVAMTHLVDDREQCLWRLAQRVHGWGRIHLVERLTGTTNEQIQAWMLREGFQNSVMDGYLAATCARTGRLHEALQSPDVDRGLLEGAAGIISALLAGGPADNLDDYEHAAEAVEGYLAQISKTRDRDLDLLHLLTVSDLTNFLTLDDGWKERLSRGWTPEQRERLRTLSESIVRWERWTLQVERGLRSTDQMAFYTANAAAKRLGIDTFHVHLARVQESCLDSISWYSLMEQTDDTRIEEVLKLACAALPLEKIASGPQTSIGLGPGFEPHQVLDTVLQALVRFPERGWSLIRTGLQSPVVRNRNLALKALLEWPRERWPADAFALLQKAQRHEPDEALKARLTGAIKVN